MISYQKGQYFDVYGHKIFVIQEGKVSKNSDVIVFFHGFPTSSYDYAKALPYLLEDFANHKLVFFDHLGFGFSDKPIENYEYTLNDHAENALELLRQLNIKSAHIIAHDMGDSILTEVLIRRHLNLLPDHFNTFFKSVTFTNGGMHLNLANLRFSQTLLNLPYIGPFFSSLWAKIPLGISSKIAQKQLASIWSPNANVIGTVIHKHNF